MYEQLWALLKAAVAEHVWLTVPISFLVPLAAKAPDIVKAALEHRRVMWELNNKEQRRLENVKKRQSKKRTKKANTDRETE